MDTLATSARLDRIRRASPVRGRRLALCGALVAAAFVVGAGLGTLFGLAVVMVVLDGLIPMPDGSGSEADYRFRRLARHRRHGRALRHRDAGDLPLLDDARGWAAVAERRSLGIREIPVMSVRGTVEPVKARTFDCAFRPDRSAREQWKRLWLAASRGAILPPISVYRVGDEHFLRDGHHRVSVARDRGVQTIDAEVTELRRPSLG